MPLLNSRNFLQYSRVFMGPVPAESLFMTRRTPVVESLVDRDIQRRPPMSAESSVITSEFVWQHFSQAGSPITCDKLRRRQLSADTQCKKLGNGRPTRMSSPGRSYARQALISPRLRWGQGRHGVPLQASDTCMISLSTPTVSNPCRPRISAAYSMPT